jgi:hypothetical protein
VNITRLRAGRELGRSKRTKRKTFGVPWRTPWFNRIQPITRSWDRRAATVLGRSEEEVGGVWGPEGAGAEDARVATAAAAAAAEQEEEEEGEEQAEEER